MIKKSLQLFNWLHIEELRWIIRICESEQEKIVKLEMNEVSWKTNMKMKDSFL